MIILNDTSITLPLFSNSYVECRGVDKGTNIVFVFFDRIKNILCNKHSYSPQHFLRVVNCSCRSLFL